MYGECWLAMLMVHWKVEVLKSIVFKFLEAMVSLAPQFQHLCYYLLFETEPRHFLCYVELVHNYVHLFFTALIFALANLLQFPLSYTKIENYFIILLH